MAPHTCWDLSGALACGILLQDSPILSLIPPANMPGPMLAVEGLGSSGQEARHTELWVADETMRDPPPSPSSGPPTITRASRPPL